MNAAQPLAWQPAFAEALRDAALPPPAGLRTWNNSDPAARLAVHRNNVAVSLTQALADSFPVVRELVGEEFFAAMARCHIAAHAPRSPVLVEYGDDLAPWLQRFEPAADLPYLPDVARLERARVRATHAAAAVPLDAATLAERLRPGLAAEPARLESSRLALHPSLGVIRSPYAVVSLWAAHQGRGRIEDVDLDTPESALVLRQGDGDAGGSDADGSEALDRLAVVVLPLTEPGALLVQRLQDGETLAEATAQARELNPDFTPEVTLALLIAQGVLIDWLMDGSLPGD